MVTGTQQAHGQRQFLFRGIYKQGRQMAKNRQHAKNLSKMDVFVFTYLMNFPFIQGVLHLPSSVFLQAHTPTQPHQDFLICFISILSLLEEDMPVNTLAVQQASPCQPFFPLPRKLKWFSRGVCACGVRGWRPTWLATSIFTHKAQVAWHLHCPSSRGHCWKKSFAFKPQSSPGFSTTPSILSKCRKLFSRAICKLRKWAVQKKGLWMGMERAETQNFSSLLY